MASKDDGPRALFRRQLAAAAADVLDPSFYGFVLRYSLRGQVYLVYERNYAGNHEDIRIQALTGARRNGNMDRMMALADRCMAEYDEEGWVGEAWLNPDGASGARR
jgi:hypothetical protein